MPRLTIAILNDLNDLRCGSLVNYICVYLRIILWM